MCSSLIYTLYTEECGGSKLHVVYLDGVLTGYYIPPFLEETSIEIWFLFTKLIEVLISLLWLIFFQYYDAF